MENLNPVNFNKAIKSFIQTYCTPELSANNIILGYQNNVALPESEDFAVFHVVDFQKRGRGERRLCDPLHNDKYLLLDTNLMKVQIDLYCNNSNCNSDKDAMLRAKSLETIANSSIGVAHFNKYNMSCIGAESMKVSIVTGDSGLLDYRWIVMLNISFNSQYVLDVDTFNTLNIKLNPLEGFKNE